MFRWSSGDDQAYDENYAAVIDINSLKQILHDGWYVYLNPNIYNTTKKFESSMTKNYRTFSLTGEFSAGKTFVINELASSGLLSGDVVHTTGISLYIKDDIVFLDTAGSGNPVKNIDEFILDRRLTDFFIE